MIFLNYVRYKNFLAVGNYWVELKLDAYDRALIVGKNGEGKSTVLDAVCFGLYGKPFRNINKPTLVNSINKKACEVEIGFTIGSNVYRVRRGIRPNIFEIYKNEVIIPEDAAVGDYQTHLEKTILGVPYRSFKQIVILGSARYVPFMELKAADRRGIIEDLLDIEIFSKMNVINKQHISNNIDSLRDIGYKIELVDEKIRMQAEHLKEMLEDVELTITGKEVEVLELKSRLLDAHKHVKDMNAQKSEWVNSIAGERPSLTKKIKELSSFRTKIEANRQKALKEIEFYAHSEKCSSCRQIIDKDFRDEVIQEKNDFVTKTDDALAQLVLKLSAVETSFDAMVVVERQIGTIDIDISVEMNNVSSITKSIRKRETEVEELRNKFKHSYSDVNVSYQGEKTEYQDTHSSLLKQQVVLKNAAIMLKDNGIKAKVVKQYIPIINKLINKYLAMMDFYVQFELDETFQETIKSRYRDEFSYNNFSEGQKLRIDLAILFTWREIARLRNNAAINLLIMDEVFDGSLDDNGTDELMRLLINLTKSTNCFIISHNDTLKERFTNVIEFQMRNNFSYIN